MFPQQVLNNQIALRDHKILFEEADRLNDETFGGMFQVVTFQTLARRSSLNIFEYQILQFKRESSPRNRLLLIKKKKTSTYLLRRVMISHLKLMLTIDREKRKWTDENKITISQ